MLWFNEPPQWDEQGSILHVQTAPHTDFWRKTHYGFIRDNGHFYYELVKGDFDVEVQVSGQYTDLYDQAGLMLRVDDQNWLKTGIEYVNGVQQVSAVFTREFSDWSIIPLPHNPSMIWLRLTRRAEAVEIFYSLNAVDYTMFRMGYLAPAETVGVGLMAASPDGPGFQVTFDGFSITRPG